MRKLAIVVAVTLLVVGALESRALAAPAGPDRPTAQAQAAGAPFPVTEFNICARACSLSPQPPGSTYTDHGLNPVAEFLDQAEANGWPRVIALNEVCGQAAFILTANLPAGLYDSSFYVSARRPADNCDLFGNWVAVRTGDVPATEASEFHFYWGAGTPPPGDNTSESRGGACLRSFIFLEQTWGCSVHLSTDEATSQANSLLGSANTWFGTSAQVMAGDFNLGPTTSAIQNWDNSNRNDLYAPVSATFEPCLCHIDYGWTHQTVLQNASSAIAYTSSSDHFQLWGTANFR